MKLTIDKILDCTGLFCPEPVMMLHKSVKSLDAGQTVQLIATDPSTQRDVLKFCRFLGHDLLEERQEADKYYYLIKKN